MRAREEVQRLFALAAQRVGGESALVRHLGIPYSELKTYLAGEAMPPQEVVFRALKLVHEDAGPGLKTFSGVHT